VGGTIYNNHTLEPFKELGLEFQRAKKLASKLHVRMFVLSVTLPDLSIPDVPFPTLGIIDSQQETA
jgi:hypothetical protein